MHCHVTCPQEAKKPFQFIILQRPARNIIIQREAEAQEGDAIHLKSHKESPLLLLPLLRWRKQLETSLGLQLSSLLSLSTELKKMFKVL